MQLAIATKAYAYYHSENPRTLKNYLKSRFPVYYNNAKAWMTVSLSATWFSDYFQPLVETYCSEQNILFKNLLLIDNAPGHPRALTESFTEIQVDFITAANGSRCDFSIHILLSKEDLGLQLYLMMFLREKSKIIEKLPGKLHQFG